MKHVYICHPLGGAIEENMTKVKSIVKELCYKEVMPLAPHLAIATVLNDNIPEERKKGLHMCLHMLNPEKIDALWIFGEKLSNGMKMEIEHCMKHSIPIRCKSEVLDHTVNGFMRMIEEKN